jgi:hypothetical protein
MSSAKPQVYLRPKQDANTPQLNAARRIPDVAKGCQPAYRALLNGREAAVIGALRALATAKAPGRPKLSPLTSS